MNDRLGAPAPDRLQSAPEPDGAVTRRAFAYGALGLLVAGAAATRIAGNAPGPAPGGNGGNAPTLVAELSALSLAAALQALATSPFTPDEQARFAPLIRERRAHLVAAPVFGLGGSVGRTVVVGCGLLSRRVVLGPSPTLVLLPIERAGRLLLTPIAHDDTTLGLVVVAGPTALPPIPAGGTAALDVIVT